MADDKMLLVKGDIAHGFADIDSFLKGFATHCIKAKQASIMQHIAGNGKTITRTVKEVSRELDCSESALWSHVFRLKKLGLIECQEGVNARLTFIGLLLVANMEGVANGHAEIEDNNGYGPLGIREKVRIRR
ncbi:MAG: hypothetical protein HY519_02270 [Candidatus Aenigmarchaeota archaeon]|nr:hypothetical protein [Candidatus Aenigmarchaeota archaeon]